MTAGGGAPSENGRDEGYPGYPRYPDRQAGTNPLAVFALVSAVAGVLSAGLVGGAGAALGIVLGTVALSQIRRSPQGGRAPALAAIVVGVATLLVSLVLRAMALHG